MVGTIVQFDWSGLECEAHVLALIVEERGSHVTYRLRVQHGFALPHTTPVPPPGTFQDVLVAIATDVHRRNRLEK